MSNQPYTTENPDPRKPEVQTEEVTNDAKVPVYEADPTRLDLSPETPDTVTATVRMDVQTAPDHPQAVIVPPEGRGVHPRLGVDAPTAEDRLASGDADEATGVEDGKVVSSSEAAERESDDSK